jgi:type II secretory pathway component PulF
MARFSYTARDRAGKTVSASVEAPSRRDALRLIAARGLSPSSVSEAPLQGVGARGPRSKAAGPARAPSPGGGLVSFGAAKARVPSRRECLPFLEALYDLTVGGLSAGEAVRLLSIRLKEPTLRALAAGLWERISEGAPLSRALGAFPGVFDSEIVNLVHAGESTGSVNDTLARLIAHLTEQRELRRQLLTAMAYPVFMTFVAAGVICFFLFFLLPRLQALLSSLGGKMPVSTKILVAFSDFALHYGVFVVLALAFVALSVWRWYGTEKGRMTADGLMLRLPLLGPFLVARSVQSFSQTLGVLLENGITAVEALRMTERQIVNRVHRQAFREATARVVEGESLSLALTRTECFPDLVLDRMTVGENTGNVVPSLRDIARKYQKEITNQLNAFTRILASAVLMGVFIFVGFIAFAIVSAVFSVSASFKMG